MRRDTKVLLAFLGMILTAAAGCSTSAWQRNYRGASVTDESLTPAKVVIRDVPWERYEKVQGELEAMRSGSDVHPDEWTTEKRGEYKSKLLKGLQVSEDPSRVEVMGNSIFKSTDKVRPEDGTLAKWAAKVGANRVVWTSRGLGKRSVVVSEPVWTYTTGSDFFRDPVDGRHRSATYTETYTTWVPVVIEAEETGWVAYYLRIAGDVK